MRYWSRSWSRSRISRQKAGLSLTDERDVEDQAVGLQQAVPGFEGTDVMRLIKEDAKCESSLA